MNAVAVIFIVLVLILMSLLLFTVGRVFRQGRRSLVVSYILPMMHRRAEDYWKNRSAEGPYFHVQKARPLGILFSVVGVAGLCATWTFAIAWEPRIVLTILFAAFVIGGVPAVVGGGCWRSRFENGHVYWEYPSRFFGRNDSCCIKDIVEFQFVSCVDSSGGGSTRYYLLLKDGTKKCVADHCFGYAEAFRRALHEENPSIVFTQKHR